MCARFAAGELGGLVDLKPSRRHITAQSNQALRTDWANAGSRARNKAWEQPQITTGSGSSKMPKRSYTLV